MTVLWWQDENAEYYVLEQFYLGNWSEIYQGTDLAFTPIDIIEGETYQYRVKGCVDAVENHFGNEASGVVRRICNSAKFSEIIVPQSPPPPAMHSYWSPDKIEVGQQAQLFWSSANTLYCFKDNDDSKKFVSSGDFVPHTFNEPAIYRATLVCEGGDGSNVNKTARIIVSPSKPNLNVDYDLNALNISWEPVNYADSYWLESLVDNQWIEIYRGSLSQYPFEIDTSVDTYSFRVKSCKRVNSRNYWDNKEWPGSEIVCSDYSSVEIDTNNRTPKIDALSVEANGILPGAIFTLKFKQQFASQCSYDTGQGQVEIPLTDLQVNHDMALYKSGATTIKVVCRTGGLKVEDSVVVDVLKLSKPTNVRKAL